MSFVTEKLAGLGWRLTQQRAGALSILIYHRVLPRPDSLLTGEPDAAHFEAQMRLLREHAQVLPLAEAIRRMYAGTLPARAVAITFDDGYTDNLTVAAPILQRLGLHATFFIATGYLDGGTMFNDRLIEAVRGCPDPVLSLPALDLPQLSLASVPDKLAAIRKLQLAAKYLVPQQREQWVAHVVEATRAVMPTHLMMTSAQVRELAAMGFDIGGHTVVHPILQSVADTQAEKDIADGADRLAVLTGSRPRLFAYPNGRPDTDYGQRHARMVERLGFEAAVSTSWGVASAGSDRFQLPRFTPWDQDYGRFSARLLIERLKRTPGHLASA